MSAQTQSQNLVWRLDTYSCLSVLDSQLHGDPQALPVTGGLGNVVTNFLGRLERDTDVSSGSNRKPRPGGTMSFGKTFKCKTILLKDHTFVCKT